MVNKPLGLAERLRGGLLGLLVGDALGVPYEFKPPTRIPAYELIEMVPPAGFARTYPEVPPATWSDDGAQALCLLASLLHCGRLDIDDLGRRLVNWLRNGYMAVDYEVFDVGNATHMAIQSLENGTPAESAGPADERANGNGSLMRVLPLALWHKGSDAELVSDARRQSLVTHGHIRSQLTCALYCLWARNELEEKTEAIDNAIDSLTGLLGSRERTVLKDEILDWPRATGTSYVVDCFNSAAFACQETGYQDVVRRAISFGNDTDTTACVAGGIAGIRVGFNAIPAAWRDGLRGQELVKPLMDGLLKHRGV